MTRYFSEQLGRYVEGVSIWNGRGGMPHEAEAARCWVARSNALLDAAPGKSKYENLQQRRRDRKQNCACGKPITGSGHKRCWDCRRTADGHRTMSSFPKCHCGRAIRSQGKT